MTNFIEIALQHGCSPVNLLHIFRIFLRTPLDGCFCKKLVITLDVRLSNKIATVHAETAYQHC